MELSSAGDRVELQILLKLQLFERSWLSKVVAIFDGDKPEDENKFRQDFPMYDSQIISALDIRDKPKVNKDAKEGMMTQGGCLKEEYKEEMITLFKNINSYFNND